MVEFKSKEESPINWRLWTFPEDARQILRLRRVVGIYQRLHKIDGPVADLEAEQALLDTDPHFRAVHKMVNQPIAFVLPPLILKALSLL